MSSQLSNFTEDWFWRNHRALCIITIQVSLSVAHKIFLWSFTAREECCGRAGARKRRVRGECQPASVPAASREPAFPPPPYLPPADTLPTYYYLFCTSTSHSYFISWGLEKTSLTMTNVTGLWAWSHYNTVLIMLCGYLPTYFSQWIELRLRCDEVVGNVFGKNSKDKIVWELIQCLFRFT